MFNGTNLILSSDVDQDTYGKVTKTQENTTGISLIRPRGYKTFLMLNSTEHKISTAHKK